MKNIITITLNPAFDLHYYLDKFEKDKENYVRSVCCDAGGKGVNISRALSVMGVQSTAFIVLGNENGAEFARQLEADGISFSPLLISGRVRENITLHPDNDRETRISLDSFSIGKDTLDELFARISEHITEGTLVSFSGRIPKGVEKSDIISFLLNIKSLGARLVVDSNSLTVDDLKKIKPFLIKPNDQEIASLLGRDVKELKDAAECAKALARGGVAEQVMISLGERGAVWSDGIRTLSVSCPAIKSPVSTIGAGDSTVAGFIAATAAKLDTGTTLRCSSAFGTASCMTEGTRPPRPEDVREMFARITVSEVLE